MKTDLARSLWFEIEAEDKPVGVCSREKLLVIETCEFEWRDADVRAPFEIVLLPWGAWRTVYSTAFARPSCERALPYVALGSHRFDGPRKWRGDLPGEEERLTKRHMRRFVKRCCGVACGAAFCGSTAS